MSHRRFPRLPSDGCIAHRKCVGSVAIALAPVLLVALVALTALAYASPPDPTWIAGIYDAADYDDIVGFLIETSAVEESVSEAALVPLPLVARLFSSVFGSVTAVCLSTPRPRSPPAA